MNSSLSISEVDGRRSSRASSVTSWFPTTNAAAAAGTTTTTTAGRNQLAMHSASFSGRSGFRVKSHQSSLKHHGKNLSPNHRATSTTVARHHSIAVCPPNPNCSIEERQTSTPTLTVDTINQMGNVECETINHERIMNVTKQQSQPQINVNHYQRKTIPTIHLVEDSSKKNSFLSIVSRLAPNKKNRNLMIKSSDNNWPDATNI